jgi:hypothetical protein
LNPNDVTIRKEYKDLMAVKSEKEKQWYSKMSGFLSSDKLKRIERKDEQEQKLKFKIRRMLGTREGAPAQSDEEEEEFQDCEDE